MWTPTFPHFSPSHHDNLIVVCNCVESMGNRDDGGLIEFLLENFLDEVICSHVNIGGRFIEEKNRSFSNQGSG